jgi:hypothetical protein
MIFEYFDNAFFVENNKSRKTKKDILFVVSIFLLIYLSGFFFSKNSEAFLTTKNFIINSPEARRELGDIIDVQLAPFGYGIEISGDSGSADFKCKVSGVLKKGNAHVTLKKNARGWKVISGTIVIEGNSMSL